MKRAVFNYEYSEKEKTIRDELANELLSDERVQNFIKKYQLKQTFFLDNVNKFRLWINELESCENCKGLSFCDKNHQGKILELEFDDSLLFIEKPCRYLQEKIEKERYLKNFWVRDIPDNLAEVSLLNLDLKGENQDYLKIVKELVIWLTNENQGKGYYLYGDVGVGKTFLSACIANDYARRGKKIAFVHVPALTSRIRSFLDDKLAFEKEIYLLKNADLLVLDDIGAETGSAWFRDEILLPILNYRMEKKALTCFNSNLNHSQLEIHYKYMKGKKADGEELNAIRIMERIRALSDEIKLEGHNRRQEQ